MRLDVAALVLLLTAAERRVSSFVLNPGRPPSCTRKVTASDFSSSSHRFSQRTRFVEEDYYFDDEDEEDGGADRWSYEYDQRASTGRARSSPAPQRKRQTQQRQRSPPPPPPRVAEAELPRDGSDPSSSVAEQELRRMPREAGEAPIVRSRRNMSSNEWDDEFEHEDYDDDDFIDDEYDEDDDYYDDDVEQDFSSGAGNFWSNPKGGLDPYPAGSSSTKSRMPPSTAEPQPDTKRRGRSRSRDRAGGSPVESYGRPPPSRRRPGAIQKTTFRSGTPPPPPLMKNFYDRFFWFGFDPRETTSPTDRTMFGGTKGKFSGLDVIREVDGRPASRRGPHGERVREGGDGRAGRRRPPRNDDEWEDDYDDDRDFFAEDDEPSDAIIPRPLLPGLSIEEKRSSRPPPPRSRRRQQQSRREEPYARSRNWFGEEDNDYNTGRRQRRKGRFQSNAEWAADEVSSWFTDDDLTNDFIDQDDDDNDDDDDYWREGSYGQSMTRSRRRRHDGRRGPRGGSIRRRRDNTPPILGLVDSVFGFDPEDINEKAKEYEEKIGRAKPKPSRSGRAISRRNEESRRHRAGYAYRYEDDDGSPPVAEYGPVGGRTLDANQDEVLDATIEEDSTQIDPGSGVIDIPAENVTGRRGSQIQSAAGRPKRARSKKRQRKRPSWEDRESEELDRIPPPGVEAYGPKGRIMDGIDARTYAALKAAEEIREAKRNVEEKEERVIDAEEQVLLLKADVEAQKRFISSSRGGRSQRARDTLRQMNMMVEDAARTLRRVRAEWDMALDAVEELEDRHWVLLSQVKGDEEFARLNAKRDADKEENVTTDDDDDNEKEEEESAASKKVEEVDVKEGEALDDIHGNPSVAEVIEGSNENDATVEDKKESKKK